MKQVETGFGNDFYSVNMSDVSSSYCILGTSLEVRERNWTLREVNESPLRLVRSGLLARKDRAKMGANSSNEICIQEKDIPDGQQIFNFITI